ncbi:MAG: cell division protein FtsZ [Moraxellaceae bacterium]|nr:cell division protein FtsZ [Pseudobdellovibrionaceae bacterium]
MFELEENVSIGASIKVVGVGGGGSNAVTTMIESGMTGVDFVVANTDIQALNSSKAGQKIQLGFDLTKGLGAGANPDVGRRSAIESYNEIVEQLKGADMVFVTAGMGGGTGTGGAPIVAKVARELGALTIGVVTKPFIFEGKKRSKHADAGLAELRENVDALIVIPNQKLLSISSEKTPLLDTFKKADEVLLQAVKGISNLINIRGLINLDFADIRTVMANKGLALMGTGAATGENRAIEAATQAISSPLLENVKIDGATGIIINVTGGSDLSLYEVNEASTLITEAASEDAEVIFGAVIDPTLNDEVRVTVIATGFARDEKKDSTNVMNSMHSFLGAPTLTFDLGVTPQAAMPAMTQEQMMKMMQQMQAQMLQQSMQLTGTPSTSTPAPFVQNPDPVHVLPPIENVQESVKTFAAQEQMPSEMIMTTPAIEPQFSQDFSSAVSPVATNTMESSTTIARDMLLAKAKAFRETQQGAGNSMTAQTTEEKVFHPEQLSMMDDQKQVEEAKKMARDILEVPAFIRKKQGFDLQQS